MEAMKAGDMKTVQAKLQTLSQLSACGKANFAMTDMLSKGYDMMKMTCDEAAKAAGAGDAEALMKAAEKCQACCMECHKKCMKPK